jgi:TolA-binding protein
MPTSLTQNFQLAPTHQGGMRYANTIDDVGKEVVYTDMPFFSKDMSVVWIKNNKGDIKTYELKEIVPMDEKDMQIQYLQSQIEELKGMIKNESNTNVSNDDTKQNATDTTTDDGATRTTTKKSKSTNV